MLYTLSNEADHNRGVFLVSVLVGVEYLLYLKDSQLFRLHPFSETVSMGTLSGTTGPFQ